MRAEATGVCSYTWSCLIRSVGSPFLSSGASRRAHIKAALTAAFSGAYGGSRPSEVLLSLYRKIIGIFKYRSGLLVIIPLQNRDFHAQFAAIPALAGAGSAAQQVRPV